MPADPRSRPASARAFIPRSSRCSTACPKALAGGPKRRRGPTGRFVRIELPGRRTLTLAEVEVYSDGRNVARQGKATQKNTAYGGDAAAGHRRQQERRLRRRRPDPHRGEHPEPLVGGRPRRRVPDRVDRGLQPHRRRPRQAARRLHPQGPRRRPQRRLRGRRNLPAPKARRRYRGRRRPGPEGAVRRAAMTALTSVRGQEAETFKALAKFVRGDGPTAPPRSGRSQRIPAADWPAEEARPAARQPARLRPHDPGARPDVARRRSTPCSSADALAGAAPARPGQAGPPGAGRAGRPGDPPGHRAPTRCSSTRTGSSSRPASRSRSSSRTPT